MDNQGVLIVGASVRAAAHSALRAGLRPVAGDLFADCDLCAACPAQRIPRAQYPGALEALAASQPAGPWIYTGALENHPDLIDRLARARPLWGNEASVVRAVRDPVLVATALHEARLPCPAVRMDPRGLPRDGSWLCKPLASAGGRGIEPLVAGDAQLARACYFQERIEGLALSALVLGQRSSATLLGVTWQWVGLPGAPFAYRGSIGPWPVAELERARIEQLGRALAAAFGLVGLFGIDLILRDGLPWPVEVNPRYTASVEVLELALGRAFLADHRRACDPNAPALDVTTPGPRSGVVGKVIVFADRPCVFPAACPWQPGVSNWFEIRSHADLPHPGTRFEAGEPVLTLFARAATVAACRARLKRLLAGWERQLRIPNDRSVE